MRASRARARAVGGQVFGVRRKEVFENLRRGLLGTVVLGAPGDLERSRKGFPKFLPILNCHAEPGWAGRPEVGRDLGKFRWDSGRGLSQNRCP